MLENIRNVLCYLEYSSANFPEKEAFVDEREAINFQQLRMQARAAASVLARFHVRNKPMAVIMEKSVRAVVSFFSIVYSGNFYCPMDPLLPQARMDVCLHTLQPVCIITQRSMQDKLESLPSVQREKIPLIFVEDLANAQSLCDEDLLLAIRRQALDIDPLYAIFTSGSTGVPKSVLISHRSVIDLMDGFTAAFRIDDSDRIGNQAPFDFDVSVKDIYSTLKTGATMYIIPRSLFSMPARLIEYMNNHKITTLIWAVSALCILTTLDAFSFDVPRYIRRIMFSGESMPVKHLNIWRRHLPDAMYVNLYGPTEITCNCLYYIVDREFAESDALPLGLPFPNTEALVLNEKNQIAGMDEIGELCVRGTCLALGYYNNAEQTMKAFVQNPLNPHHPEIIYRTGDLVRFNDRREMVYAGRRDFQIKHMGFRIELAEIENAVQSLAGVDRCVCQYLADKHKIILFYEGMAERERILKGLQPLLPKHMFPQKFIRLPKLPLNKNGKIDRTKLMEEHVEKD